MMGRRACFPCRTAVTDNRARAKICKRLAGCSGSPAAIGQPLRPVTLRPPSFAGGSPCQNTLMPGIVANGMARLRHRDCVDHVTEYLNATATYGDIRQTCRSLLIDRCRHLAGFRPLVSSEKRRGVISRSAGVVSFGLEPRPREVRIINKPIDHTHRAGCKESLYSSLPCSKSIVSNSLG